MNLYWYIVALPLIGGVFAIPCSDIGWDLITGPPGSKVAVNTRYPNPLDNSAGLWEIIRAADPNNRMFLRCQMYQTTDATRLTSRMTQTTFSHTPEQVETTLKDFYNTRGNNQQLWLSFDTLGLQYINLFKNIPYAFDYGLYQPVIPQNLDMTRSVISIILPSGRRKLTTVSYPSDCESTDKAEFDKATGAGITGLSGTIDADEYIYVNGLDLQYGLWRLAHRQQGKINKDAVPGWITAEKANGDCLVIDLTGFMVFKEK